jgi:enamine deaminase RidA (YjgF/YER057c/UK114 family)
VNRLIEPEGWRRPRGYSNGVAARGELVFVAGQIGWDERQQLVSRDLAAQCTQALRNVVAVLAAAGALPEHVVRMTWYVTGKGEYLEASREIGGIFRELFGGHYPAMTLVEVADLLEDGAKVEIEATAVIPD